MIPRWFLYVGGFSMVILGVLQLYARPRRREDTLYRRFVNLGTLWSMLCLAVGASLLAMALGYWDGPLGSMRPPEPAPKLKRRHLH